MFTRRKRVRNPGRVRLRVCELAEARGDLNQFGKVNVKKIVDGTELTRVTVEQLVRHPDVPTRMDFETMARLCMHFDCEVGDLFRLEPPLKRSA